MPENGESDESGEEAGGRVHEASDDGISAEKRYHVIQKSNLVVLTDLLLDAVVVELVVGPQGGEGAGPDAVGEEDLGGAVDPRL